MPNADGSAVSSTKRMQRFLSILDFGPDELTECLHLAAHLKADRAAGALHAKPLDGRHVALLFEKPSLRTRSTFQIAIHELGGETIEPQEAVTFGGRESITDVAKNLERWVYATVVRTFAQSRLQAFADAAPGLRVVNALTDEEHPCQALADCLTLVERWGSLRGRIDDLVWQLISRRGGDAQRHTHHRRDVGQRCRDVVAVADKRHRPAAAVAPSLAQRERVSERLTRMLFVGQRVDDVKLLSGVGDNRGLFLGVGPDDERADPTFEVAGDVHERLANTFGKLSRQMQRVAAQLTNRDLERGARPQ